ncbi:MULTISPECIES: CNP1-like family protein [unclassified Cupriavidus]|uniref:CNP1-like family protein n=1 Tax=unclassified Cupriavidus TaxID=2640874 RepID=UPI00088F323F|nr:CNP1-like family protein [Cupriavidus sp. YR651]SDD79950.1 CNP1-like family protein [Cupriavidus sp. YR651]
MNSFTGRGARAGQPASRALRGTCLLLAAACLTLAGCKTTSKGMPEEESQWINPFEPKDFKEAETLLPPLPKDADLIPFSVSGTGDFRFAVDGKSIAVGADNVVRYTVVITSPGGGRNVNYEGMRCDAFERKLYATLPQGATEWVPNRSEDRDTWYRMETRARNAYSATLAKDFFCEGRTVAGKPAQMAADLKAHAPSR